MKALVLLTMMLTLQCADAMAATPLAETDAASASKVKTPGKLSRVASGQTEHVPSPRRPQPVAEQAGRISPASRPATDYAAVSASKDMRTAKRESATPEKGVRKPAIPDQTQ